MPVVRSLEHGIKTILSCKWKSTSIGKMALKSAVKVLSIAKFKPVVTSLLLSVARTLVATWPPHARWSGSRITLPLKKVCPSLIVVLALVQSLPWLPALRQSASPPSNLMQLSVKLYGKTYLCWDCNHPWYILLFICPGPLIFPWLDLCRRNIII